MNETADEEPWNPAPKLRSIVDLEDPEGWNIGDLLDAADEVDKLRYVLNAIGWECDPEFSPFSDPEDARRRFYKMITARIGKPVPPEEMS